MYIHYSCGFLFYRATVTHGVGVEVISERLGYTSIKTTMRYLGIIEDEVVGILMNEI